jgi:hypothetical protein
MTRGSVALVATAVALALVGCVAVVLAGGGVEFNLIYVQPSPEYYGGIGVYAVPLNVSDPQLLQYSSLYVVDAQGIPRYSYAFSNLPPLIFFLEQSLGVGQYQAYYGGTNPYSSFVAMPGTQQSIWAAFDDFDYRTGFWMEYNASLGGGKYAVAPGGFIALNVGYGQDVVHAFLVLGRRAFWVRFNASEGWVVATLTSREFADWGSIADGSDIYFINPDGTPLYYSIIYLSKVEKILVFAVELRGSDRVLMLYGGVNPYASYRVSFG